MTKSFYAGLLLSLLVVLMSSLVFGKEPKNKWFNNVAEAKQMGKKLNKPILVFVFDLTSKKSSKLEKRFASKVFQKVLRGFVLARVPKTDPNLTHKEDIDFIPHVQLLTPQGQKRRGIDGLASKKTYLEELKNFEALLAKDQKEKATQGSVYGTGISNKEKQKALEKFSKPKKALYDLVENQQIKWLKPPSSSSPVKVFEVDIKDYPHVKYGIDLRVVIERRAKDEKELGFRKSLEKGLSQGALYFQWALEGQMVISSIKIFPETQYSRGTDVWVKQEKVIFKEGAHCEQIEEKKEGEQTGKRIGKYIVLPKKTPAGELIMWETKGLLIAHELLHHIVGLPDEFSFPNFNPRCTPCVMANSGLVLCKKDNHTDPIAKTSCWEQAKALYPKLKIPKKYNPGALSFLEPKIRTISKPSQLK